MTSPTCCQWGCPKCVGAHSEAESLRAELAQARQELAEAQAAASIHADEHRKARQEVATLKAANADLHHRKQLAFNDAEEAEGRAAVAERAATAAIAAAGRTGAALRDSQRWARWWRKAAKEDRRRRPRP